MNFPITLSWLVLAQPDRREDVFRAFRSTPTASGTSGVVVGLLILAGLVALLALFSAILYWQQRRRRHSSPGQLFLSLCRAHRLRWKECWWLWQLARQQHLADPGRLFLEPERFDTVQIPAALQPRRSRFQELRERLFRPGPEKKPDQPAAPTASPPTGAALPPPAAPPTLNIPPWTSPVEDPSSLPSSP
jgi:hypothetical protein